MACSPDCCRIAATIVVVVVFPLVPVIVIQSAVLRPARWRTRQASSTSPQIGIPDCCAATSSGCAGGRPGEVTTSSAGSPPTSGKSRELSAPRSTSSTPTIFSVSAACSAAASSEAATTTTRAPSSAKVSAIEKPVLPIPVTTTRNPDQSESQLVSPASREPSVGLTAGRPPIRRRKHPARRPRTSRRGSRTGPPRSPRPSP